MESRFREVLEKAIIKSMRQLYRSLDDSIQSSSNAWVVEMNDIIKSVVDNILSTIEDYEVINLTSEEVVGFISNKVYAMTEVLYKLDKSTIKELYLKCVTLIILARDSSLKECLQCGKLIKKEGNVFCNVCEEIYGDSGKLAILAKDFGEKFNKLTTDVATTTYFSRYDVNRELLLTKNMLMLCYDYICNVSDLSSRHGGTTTRDLDNMRHLIDSIMGELTINMNGCVSNNLDKINNISSKIEDDRSNSEFTITLHDKNIDLYTTCNSNIDIVEFVDEHVSLISDSLYKELSDRGSCYYYKFSSKGHLGFSIRDAIAFICRNKKTRLAVLDITDCGVVEQNFKDMVRVIESLDCKAKVLFVSVVQANKVTSVSPFAKRIYL